MKVLFPYLNRFRTVNWSRYHALLSELARMGHEVWVIEPPPANLSEIGWLDTDTPELPESIHVLTAEAPPRWDRHFPFERLLKKGMYALSIRPQVESLIRSEGIDVLLLYNLPLAPLLGVRADVTIAFDLCDNLVAMLAEEAPVPGAATIGASVLRRMIAGADVVTAASASLLRYTEGRGILVPNGTAVRERVNQDADGPFGFIGAFEYFVDFGLVLETAARLRHRRFSLVGGGRAWSAVAEAARELPNVEVREAVPHHRMRTVLDGWAAGMVPFTRSPVAKDASPMKALDYLGAGLPVVATEIREAWEVNRTAQEAAVRLAESPAEFGRLLEEAAEAGLSGEARERVVQFYSWSAQTRHLLSAWGGEASLARGA